MYLKPLSLFLSAMSLLIANDTPVQPTLPTETKEEQHDFSLFGYSNPLYQHYFIGLEPPSAKIQAAPDIIYLEDGSGWKLQTSRDIHEINTWAQKDPIKITPNVGWFTKGYGYIITNTVSSSYVYADLYKCSEPGRPTTRYIDSIDCYYGIIKLDNGQIFILSSNDYATFQKWQAGDYIIVASYESYFSSYVYYLINVNMNQGIRAAIAK